jgi:Na+-driven multidrug efflux pump
MIQAVNVPLAFVLNGLSILRIQGVLGLAMAVTNIALSVVGAHVIGIAGPAWATVLTETVIIVGPLWFVAQRRLRALIEASSTIEPDAAPRSALRLSNRQ